MHGARERNPLRWDARRALLSSEIERLKRTHAQARDDAQREHLQRQIEDAERRLRQLGPSPAAKMG
jgi:type VI protein secretion system component VasF